MRSRASLCLMFVLAACGGEEDRPEVLSKLRGLGATTTPLVAMPSVPGETPRQVTLTVYAALPHDQQATIEPYMDEPSAFAVNIDPSKITISNALYESRPGFQILTFSAAVEVPAAPMFAATGGAGQARYGFLLKAGDEEEKLIGNFLVYPEGSPELNWSHPEITLASPTSGAEIAAESDVDIAATLTDKNDEDLKVGWFVSGGEIKNRRAKSTVWKTPGPGEQTLIVTARGKKSRGFAIEIITVNTK